MSDRWERRKYEKETQKLVKKAKQDMISWMDTLSYVPSEQEIRAWQEGYLSGINRANNRTGAVSSAG
jgi:hypothetical protein